MVILSHNLYWSRPYTTSDDSGKGGLAKSDFILKGALTKHLMRGERGQKRAKKIDTSLKKDLTQSIFQILAGDISHNQFCNLFQPVVDMVPPILCLNTFAESFFHDLPKSNSKFLLGISGLHSLFYSLVD